jgi:hypothetical protein
MNYSEQSQAVQGLPPSDGASILDSINPEADVIRIINNFLGLKISVKVNGGTRTTSIVRVNKPEFTDEFVQNIGSDLYQLLNFTIQVSRFQDKDIKQKVGKFLLSLTKDFATHGDDNYISDETWARIIEVHNSELTEKGAGKGWDKHGINWRYNDPVNYDMIRYVKDFREEVDQIVKFRKYIVTIGAIVNASFNKSFSSNHNELGMVLRAIREIRTETNNTREIEQKRGIGAMFGRNQTQPEER